ncbi:hypothetical protein [Streptomyces sp. NPDC089919]|uniref:hypothetical protein n=1 Tax=Streptomyces sp. NPDC089919 TaxID=3155188 RepID=UPI0034195059
MHASTLFKKWRGRALAAATTLALAGGTLGLAAGPAAAAPSFGRAYVWANSPAAALGSPYVPAGAYSRNSTGATNTVVRTGTGQYTVRMPNLGRIGGVVHVTAYGPGSHTCSTVSWVPNGSRLDVRVACFTRTGVRANSMFTASFENTAALGGTRYAYLWANQPSAAGYVPATAYQFNSAGATNTITRSGTGSYLVRLPAIGSSAGHVQVTAYGDAAARCKVGSWTVSGTAQLVRVYCSNAFGRALDHRFSLTYTRATGLLRTTPAAYAWADRPTNAGYNPAAAYSYNSSGVVNRIRRTGVGVYQFHPANMPLANGTVQVTAYGPDAAYCKVDFWTPGSGVQVRCFSALGAPKDTFYDVSFQR